MGTSKPLKILCVGQAPEVTNLVQKGHTVTVHTGELLDYDLILGPTCCRFLPGMDKYLDSIIKGARLVKYGPTKKAKEK